jgi:hypothetical protein
VLFGITSDPAKVTVTITGINNAVAQQNLSWSEYRDYLLHSVSPILALRVISREQNNSVAIGSVTDIT